MAKAAMLNAVNTKTRRDKYTHSTPEDTKMELRNITYCRALTGFTPCRTSQLDAIPPVTPPTKDARYGIQANAAMDPKLKPWESDRYLGIQKR